MDEAKVEGSEKDKIEEKIKDLEDAIKTDDTEEIKAKTDALSETIYSMSEQLYKNAQAGQEGQAGNGGSDDDDVVDADYEVVDDEE